MAAPDYSPANVRCALVVVKAMYRALGYDPIGVQLTVTPAAAEHIWEREARRYLLESYRRRHYGLRPLRPADLPYLQDVPEEWDALAGERPGEDDRVPTRKDFYLDARAPFAVVER